LLVIVFTFIFTGCGGGGSSGNGTSQTLKGLFLDSAVSGVKYKTSSGLEGYTNNKGEYEYKDGDTVEFFVGDVSLGTTEASSMLTTDNFPFPIQVAQFLQTLDTDGITDNGLQIAANLHSSPLFKKATPKGDDISSFGKNLNISDFDSSTSNQLFLNEVTSEANIPDREIVSESNAFKHKQKSEKLRHIKENNPELYSYIDGSFETEDRLPSDSNIHTMLASRLAYYFYSKIYEPELDLKVDLHFDAMRNIVTTQEKIEEFASTYLNIGGLATEVVVYTSDFISGQSDDALDMTMKKRIGNAVMTSGRSEVVNSIFGETGRSIVGAVDNCLPMIPTSWPSLNGLVGEQFNNAVKLIFKNAGKAGSAVVNCAMGEVVETTGRFVNTYKGSISIQEYEHIAIAKKYLDTYFSCGYLNTSCMASQLGGNETMNAQLQYIMEENQLDTGIDISVRTGAKIIIDEYLTTITSFTNDITDSLPKDAFFNYQDGDRDTTTLDLAINPLKLVNDDQGILWINLNVENLSGRDIYLTSFTPKFVVNGQEFIVASDVYGEWASKLFDRSFTKSSLTKDIRIPISLNNHSLPQEGLARLVLEVDYMSTDRVFSNSVQRVIKLDLAELWNSTKMEQLDAKLVTISKIIDTADEESKYYLPNVLLGGNIVSSNDNVAWEVNSRSYDVGTIELGIDSTGHYVILPALKEGFNSDNIVLNVFVSSSPYSEPAIFVLNIARKPIIEQKSLILPDGTIGNKWIDLGDFGSISDTYMDVNAYANYSNTTGVYQCTELVKRFYNSVYNINRTTTGNGKDVALNYSEEEGTYNNQSIIVDYHKNSLSKTPPTNGSIISFSRNDDIGHVAIVKKVECSTDSNCTVYLFEQNWIWTAGNKISHSRTATFKKEGDYWSGYDNETNRNNVIGWTTVRLNGDNEVPIANAGENKIVELNEEVVLDGKDSSDDGVITSYKWIENDNVLSTEKIFTTSSLTLGKHTITLTVTDNFGESASDTVEITVYNDESDTDSDGMPDKWEVANGLNPLVDDAQIDMDNDGRNNLLEYQHGTNPTIKDESPSLNIPTNVIAVSGDGKVNLSWNDVANAELYTVYWNTTSDVSTSNYLSKMGVSTNTYEVKGLSNYHEYYFIITAANLEIESLASSKVSSIPRKVIGSSLLKKTGQEKSYLNYDDGWYNAGINSSYTRDDNNEIVYDNSSKLIWLDSPSVANNRLSFAEAQEFCETLEHASITSWRLPTIKELEGLIDESLYSPAIDPIFKNIAYKSYPEYDNYWSSYNDSSEENIKYSVMFSYGQLIKIDLTNEASHQQLYRQNNYARCVSGDTINRELIQTDFTIIDNILGLEWQNINITQHDSIEKSIEYCEDLDLDNKHDWRLPNVRELFTLYNPELDTSSVNIEYIHDARYRTSSRYAPLVDWYQIIQFKPFSEGAMLNGYQYDFIPYTRCVRDQDKIQFKGLIYKVITSPYTGRKWLDRNLGATQVCTSSDSSACFGDYYQWGRKNASSGAKSYWRLSDINSESNAFIYEVSDWTSPYVDESGSLRELNWEKTTGEYACPRDYRLPTSDELKAETVDVGLRGDELFDSFLKLPYSGRKGWYYAYVYDRGTVGVLWTSNVTSNESRNEAYGLTFSNTSIGIFPRTRGDGNAIRCIKDSIH